MSRHNALTDPPDAPGLRAADIPSHFRDYEAAAAQPAPAPDHHGVVVDVEQRGEVYEVTVELEGGGRLVALTADADVATVGRLVRWTPHAHRVIDGRARRAEENSTP